MATISENMNTKAVGQERAIATSAPLKAADGAETQVKSAEMKPKAETANAGSGEAAAATSGEATTDASAAANANAQQFINTTQQAQTTQRLVTALKQDDVSIDHVDHVDVDPLEQRLNEIKDNAVQQSQQKIDYATNQSVNELQRNEEDAAQTFQNQRDQVSAEEQKALDNQALYAQARGENGGLGAAQYADIQATAAQNRQTVNNAQVKLSTDTARQISDLRAQGEFQKADELLSITQNYLSQLMNLEQWAMSTNLSVDEFNRQIDEWVAEFNRTTQQMQIETELTTAQLTGAFSDGSTTLAAQQYLNEALAAAGQAAMQMGITPTAEQIAAMGFTPEQWAERNKRPTGGGGNGWYDTYNSNIAALQDQINSMSGYARVDSDGQWGPQTEQAAYALGLLND